MTSTLQHHVYDSYMDCGESQASLVYFKLSEKKLPTTSID